MGGISHEEYEEEMADFTEWALRFEKMDADVEAELIERMRRQSR